MAGRRQLHGPRVANPGLLLQNDFADGPGGGLSEVGLFCACLAWSQFRIVIALRDRTLPTVLVALDAAFRLLLSFGTEMASICQPDPENRGHLSVFGYAGVDQWAIASAVSPVVHIVIPLLFTSSLAVRSI